MQASNFPPDIVEKILCQAHYLDIVRCRRVCKLWESMISLSTALQYIVWLGIHGKVDGDESFQPRTSAERLELLFDHERSWATLKPRLRSLRPMRLPFRSYLCGSDLLLLLVPRAPPGAGFKGIISRLASTVAPISESQDEMIGDELNLALYTIDPENDLIIITSSLLSLSQVDIRSLRSPSVAHPFSLTPSLNWEPFIGMFHGPEGISNYRCILLPPESMAAGPYLIRQYGLVASSDLGGASWDMEHSYSASIIVFFSWITGRVIARQVFPWEKREIRGIGTFCLISPTVFVVPVIQYIGASTQKRRYQLSISLHVYDISQSSTSDELNCPVPALTGIFSLPVFEDHLRNSWFNVKCGCGISSREFHPHWPPEAQKLAMKKPFHPLQQSDEKIFTVTVRREPTQPKMLFMIYTKSLIVSSSLPTVAIPWASWSSENAVCSEIPCHSAVATYGERVAIVSYDDHRLGTQANEQWVLEVLDFRIARLRWLAALQRNYGVDSPRLNLPESSSSDLLEMLDHSVLESADGMAQPSTWPIPLTTPEPDNETASHAASVTPGTTSSVLPTNAPRDFTESGLNFVRTAIHLPGPRSIQLDSEMDLTMDAERIILTMPHVVDDPGPEEPLGTRLIVAPDTHPTLAMLAQTPGLSLSLDAVEQILYQSSYLDIVRCRAVCKSWESMISSSIALQYAVWLGIHGKEDGDDSFYPRTSAERLMLLLEHERSWATLTPRIRGRRKINNHSRSHLHGSDVLFIVESRVPWDGTFQGVLHHLNSSIASHGETQDELIENESELDSCIVNAENNLLIIPEWTHHIRSLRSPSIGHPLAQISSVNLSRAVQMLYSPPSYPNYYPVYDLPMSLTAGPYLIQQYSIWARSRSEGDSWGKGNPNSASVILVLNWTTGQIVARCVFSWEDADVRQVRNLCLLSPNIFVVPVTRKIPGTEERADGISISLHVYDFSRSSATDELGCSVPVLTGIFSLPEFQEHDSFSWLTVECRCSVTSHELLFHWPPGAQPSISEKPFHPHHEINDKIFTVSVQQGYQADKLLLMIYVRALLSQSNAPVTPLPWTSWGQAYSSATWIPPFAAVAASGERVAIAFYELSSNSLEMPFGYKWTLEVLDFNTARVRRRAALQRANGDGSSRSMDLASGLSAPIQPPLIWPMLPPHINYDVDSMPTLWNASHLPTGEAPEDASLGFSLGSASLLHKVFCLPGLRCSHGDPQVELHMDAERIIVTMPHHVDDAALDEPSRMRSYMEIFAF
ncbi:hypothetical protein DL93DRAFT_2098067 [Clavulina sp. PMI_390]|nr:hypothetical protein DL93DRAFT_2098067 [Clavulina sp. PMI_390]